MLHAKFRFGESQDQYYSNKTRAVVSVKVMVKHNCQVGSSRDFGLKKHDDVCVSYKSLYVEKQHEVQVHKRQAIA